MTSSILARKQAIQNGPLFSFLKQGRWFDREKNEKTACFPGAIDITQIDARRAKDQSSWHRHYAASLQSSDVVFLLVWGSGKGTSALPRFKQEVVMRALETRFYQDKHASLIFTTTYGLTNWLYSISQFCLVSTPVWSFGAGKPLRHTWEADHG